MSPSRTDIPPALSVARNCGLAILAFFGARTVYLHAAELGSRDPFAELRDESNTGINQSVGIRLKDVGLKAYHAGKLLSSSRTDLVDISKDRQLFTLTGMHDGVYIQNGKPFHYEASQGLWRANARQLTITGSARVHNADLDLSSSSIVLDQDKHSLRALDAISGRLYKGSIRAVGFLLDTDTHDFTTGHAEYRGDLTSFQKGEPQSESADKKVWTVSGEGVKSKGPTTYYWKGVAQDDEILIKADLVAQNQTTDIVVATGNVKYFSGKADVTADKATVYRKEKRVVLVGHVTIYVKAKADQDKPPREESVPEVQRTDPDQVVPVQDLKVGQISADPKGVGAKSIPPQTAQQPPVKPPVANPLQKPASAKDANAKPQTPEDKKLDDDLRTGKTIRQYPIIIICDQVEDWYGKGNRHAHVVGKPQGRQELPGSRWRYVWASTADYDGEHDELTLYSSKGKVDVRMKNSKGDDLTGAEFTVSTKDDSDEDSYRGRKVHGTIVSDSDDETSPDGKAKAPTDKSKAPTGGPAAPKKTGGT